MVEILIVGLGGVGSKGLVGGPIRPLTVGLGKVIIPVQDDSRVALMGGKNEDVGVGAKRAISKIPTTLLQQPNLFESEKSALRSLRTNPNILILPTIRAT